MICEEERKLHKLKMDEEKEFKIAFLPVATEPLGKETPQGYNFNVGRREERHKAEARLEAIKIDHQEHIKNCSTCK